jgi:hypothetical protein
VAGAEPVAQCQRQRQCDERPAEAGEQDGGEPDQEPISGHVASTADLPGDAGVPIRIDRLEALQAN